MKQKQSFQKEKRIFGRCVCVLKLTLHCRKVIRKSLFEWSHQKGEFYVGKNFHMQSHYRKLRLYNPDDQTL